MLKSPERSGGAYGSGSGKETRVMKARPNGTFPVIVIPGAKGNRLHIGNGFRSAMEQRQHHGSTVP